MTRSNVRSSRARRAPSILAIALGGASALLCAGVPVVASAQVVKATYRCTAYQSNLDKKWAYGFAFQTERDRDGFFRAPAALEANVYKLESTGGRPPAFAFVAKLPLTRQASPNPYRVNFRGVTPTGAPFVASFVSDTTWNAFDRVSVSHDGRAAWGACTLVRP